MFIYLNGEFVKAEKAGISPFDHGYLYGLGAFETFRVYQGHPFLLKDHFQRLQKALNELNVQSDLSYERMKEIVQELIKVNKAEKEEVYVRFNVSAGIGEVGLQVLTYNSPTIICFMKPLSGRLTEEKTGHIVSLKRNTPEGTFRLKSHHFMNNIFAKREVGNDPSIEGLFLTQEGFVAEGIASNIFWVKNKTVYTPSLETGILNGITRDFVLACLKRENFSFREGLFLLNDLLQADEVFVTNSIQEIVPIKSIGTKSFSGTKGPIVQSLIKMYQTNRHLLFTKEELKGKEG
ncbi:aminodeoxychorismate lyase [Metabacillus arenae]|uniref:Aminodeoxychorismate lyase n=1 Tax=Metabacillus arenae TaxID=2771434 RepID=A0A926RZU4_9BACI|nr:aminodeoxychorismate lyase [Metabacillus arenae]MBD1383195.1 aminodeoxychorismate lyase [Metabacillus arenae]